MVLNRQWFDHHSYYVFKRKNKKPQVNWGFLFFSLGNSFPNPTSFPLTHQQAPVRIYE